jgi:hypothetical protein
MNKNIFTVILVFAGFTLYGQQISSDVIASSGGNFTSSSGVSLSFTIGECVTKTFTGSTVTLSQGFHQGYYEVTPLAVNESYQVNMNVFPLPATDYITIELGDLKDNYHAEIYDINGREVLTKELTSETTNLNLMDFATGTYILVVTDGEYNTIKSMQIVKN